MVVCFGVETGDLRGMDCGGDEDGTGWDGMDKDRGC